MHHALGKNAEIQTGQSASHRYLGYLCSTSQANMLRGGKHFHGNELAAAIAQSMIHSHVRTPNEPQRMDLPARTGVNDPTLLEIIELMKANIEEPLASADLALLTQESRRKLERLFQPFLNTSPSNYYLQIQLDATHQKLQNSSIKIINAALACGFKSQGHFNARYHARYGKTPRENREK